MTCITTEGLTDLRVLSKTEQVEFKLAGGLL